MKNFREIVSEILVRWGMGTRQAAILEIVREHEQRIAMQHSRSYDAGYIIGRNEMPKSYKKGFAEGSKETAKAFGGCLGCYGKGYSTVIVGYSDESAGTKWSEKDILYCKCDRGTQLKKIIGDRPFVSKR